MLNDIFPLISFADYFASFTPRPSYPDPVIVTSPKYVESIASIVEEEDDKVLEAYFVTRIVQTVGPFTRLVLSYCLTHSLHQLGAYLGPKETLRKEFEWLDNYLGGVEQGVSTPRADVCLASLLENYGFLIGRYYIQRAFTGACLPQVLLVFVADAIGTRR